MSSQEQTIQRYLLGQLSESEQVILEENYFNDQQLFEKMVQVENDLVDQYARGLLPPATRDRFENYYMAHPERRERAHFAGALAAKVDASPGVQTVLAEASWRDRFSAVMRGPKLVWGFSIVLLLFAVLAGWMFIETRRLRKELAQSASERAAQAQRERSLQEQLTSEQQRSSKLEEELAGVQSQQQAARPSPSPQPSTFATLILSIAGTRSTNGGAPVALRIPAGAEQVRVQLNLRENSYSRYQVVIQSAGGKTILTRQLTAPSKKINANLSLIIPSQSLPTGDYILTLRGATTAADFEDVSKSLFHVSVGKKQ